MPLYFKYICTVSTTSVLLYSDTALSKPCTRVTVLRSSYHLTISYSITNIDLTSQLWSKNNNIIVNSSNIINHNQYEELLINFINIINIQNKNALNNIYNVIGATRLTTSTNNVYDYNNASIGYYRVNYSDSTYADFDAKISNYILVDNLPTAQYEMIVYVPDDKLVNNIQLISNDKATIYQTIDMTSYSTGLYNITQNVKIE